MHAGRPFVLSIAGFDPSAGAGVLADIKTFEQHQVYGLSIITANTIQTENQFSAMQWIDLQWVLDAVRLLFQKYSIEAVKIGIVPSLQYLQAIVNEIREHAETVKIVWDTVLKSTTGCEFTTIENQSELLSVLQQIDLITPNYKEILQLIPQQASAEDNARILSDYCAVLLKGGHNAEALGTDYLYTKTKKIILAPETAKASDKHGSGCVLSSAITANLALHHDLPKSCQKAKLYIEHYLNTNNTLLGYHYV